MKSGVCPKCGSQEVYSGEHLPRWTKQGSYWANSVPITGWNYGELDNYVCVDCGYVESYIGNRAKLHKIAEKWPRVGGYERMLQGPTKPCPNCGSALPDDWKACPYCGQPMM